MGSSDMKHLNYLEALAMSDVEVLRSKEATYQGSWKKAGGRSAWFMMRRNMDRLITMMAKPITPHGFSLADLDDVIAQARESDARITGSGDTIMDYSIVEHLRDTYVSEDIFAKIEEKPSGADGTVLACIRDLRRYLLLIESEMVSERVVLPETPYKRAVEKVVVGHEFAGGGGSGYVEEKPRTPLDGGQHAGLFPWSIDDEALERMTDRTKGAALKFYKHRATDLNVLEEAVHDSNMPRELVSCYHFFMETKWWVLGIHLVPDDLREYYPVLPKELNAKEFQERPVWQQHFYKWQPNGQSGKFIILEQHEAWTEGAK